MAFAGQWQYRSFHRKPETDVPAEQLLFGQGLLTLSHIYPNLIGGSLDMGENYILDISGQVQQGLLVFTGKGRPSTPTAGWVYDYKANFAPVFMEATSGNYLTLHGTVLRTVQHGNSPAGYVASFIAVQIPELPMSVVKEFAKKHHRLHHMVWHAVRNRWELLSPDDQDLITKLGWKPPRPSLKFEKKVRTRPYTENNAGEDFLFMHRRMITIFDQMMENEKTTFDGWITIPAPYENPAVPPAWPIPGSPADEAALKSVKSDEFYFSNFLGWDQQFKDPVYLRNLTLGELGAEIEWSVHNAMHNRWSSIPVDPETKSPVPEGRAPSDLSDKWDDISNQDLGDFYSSHVHPLFWRLHKWIDARMEDWFAAHGLAHPGEVERQTLDGTEWFVSEKWVMKNRPWEMGTSHDEETMKQVLTIIFPTTHKIVVRSLIALK